MPQLLHALQRQRSTPPDQLDPRVTGWRSACQCGWRGTQPSGRCRTLVQLRPRVCRATSPVTRSLSGDGQVRCGEKHPSPRACAPRAKIGPSRTARRGGIPSRASAGAGRRGHHHDMQCTLDPARSRDRAGGAPVDCPQPATTARRRVSRSACRRSGPNRSSGRPCGATSPWSSSGAARRARRFARPDRTRPPPAHANPSRRSSAGRS